MFSVRCVNALQRTIPVLRCSSLSNTTTTTTTTYRSQTTQVFTKEPLENILDRISVDHRISADPAHDDHLYAWGLNVVSCHPLLIDTIMSKCIQRPAVVVEESKSIPEEQVPNNNLTPPSRSLFSIFSALLKRMFTSNSKAAMNNDSSSDLLPDPNTFRTQHLLALYPVEKVVTPEKNNRVEFIVSMVVLFTRSNDAFRKELESQITSRVRSLSEREIIEKCHLLMKRFGLKEPDEAMLIYDAQIHATKNSLLDGSYQVTRVHVTNFETKEDLLVLTPHQF